MTEPSQDPDAHYPPTKRLRRFVARRGPPPHGLLYRLHLEAGAIEIRPDREEVAALLNAADRIYEGQPKGENAELRQLTAKLEKGTPASSIDDTVPGVFKVVVDWRPAIPDQDQADSHVTLGDWLSARP